MTDEESMNLLKEWLSQRVQDVPAAKSPEPRILTSGEAYELLRQAEESSKGTV